MIAFDDATGDTLTGQHDTSFTTTCVIGFDCRCGGCLDKTEEDVLWMIADYREQREHLKSLWLEVLRKKQALVQKHYECRLYCRRLLMSKSGWIARVGYRKKRN